jgi:uncharacterized membrane protein YdjX (TVP38/TMEM64 family)
MGPRRIGRQLWRPLLLLGGLLAAGWALHEVAEAGWGESLAAAALSPWGRFGFVAAGALACAVGAPRQAVAYAGGWGFAFPLGLALAMAAQVLGCVLDFAWARALARGWARRRMGARMRRLDGFLAAHPFAATLMLRLLPVGNNLALNLLAGASACPPTRFLAASALGYLPQTIVFVLLGSGTQLERAQELALGLALFGLSALLGLYLLRRFRRFSGDAADAPYAATPPG